MNQPLPINHAALAQDRRARLALLIAQSTKWVILLIIVVLGGVGLALPRYPQILPYSASMLPILAACLLYPGLYQKGQIQLGLRMLVGSFFFTLFCVPIILPEIFTVVASALGVLLLFAFFLLGSRDALLTAGINVFVYGGLMVMIDTHALHLFPPLDPTAALVLKTLMFMMVIAGTTMGLYQLITEQERLYQYQEAANQQLDLSAQQQRQGRERLEQMVRACVAYMTQVSQGNMLAHLALDAQPGEPMHVLGQNLAAMTGTLREMIVQLKTAAENLNRAAVEILAATSQQVSGASEQAAAISQTTITVDEVKAIAEQSLLRAQELTNLSQRTVEIVSSGKQSVSATVLGMQQIRGLVERIAENILSLSERTQRIGEIIATVNDIAAQSNMLALNASVEAARAGEQGKGFSVVAAEMRSLADQSRRATAQVKGILSDIQQATNTTVMVTEEGSKGVDQGVGLADRTGQSIEGLARAIEEAAQAAAQMAAGGHQQMTGVDQVALSIRSINQAMVQNLSSTRQAEHAAQDLTALASSLTVMISEYRVN